MQWRAPGVASARWKADGHVCHITLVTEHLKRLLVGKVQQADETVGNRHVGALGNIQRADGVTEGQGLRLLAHELHL